MMPEILIASMLSFVARGFASLKNAAKQIILLSIVRE